MGVNKDWVNIPRPPAPKVSPQYVRGRAMAPRRRLIKLSLAAPRASVTGRAARGPAARRPAAPLNTVGLGKEPTPGKRRAALGPRHQSPRQKKNKVTTVKPPPSAQMCTNVLVHVTVATSLLFIYIYYLFSLSVKHSNQSWWLLEQREN